MSDIVASFNYTQLDEDTRAFLLEKEAEMELVLRRTAKELGLILLDIKARLPHGQYMPWLASKGISQSTAHRWMQVASGKDIKSPKMNDLPLQMSAPEEKQDPFDAALDFLNKSLDEATTLEELKVVRDRASEMQQLASERTLRLTRRIGYLMQNDEIKPSGYEAALMRATKKLEPLLKELEKTDYATFYKTGVVINREPTFEEWQATLVILTKIAAITEPFNQE